ncbi:MAG: hypothetical protein LBG71_02000 [Clostridiales Family XIII bacterium]|jgi:hypothetical protein|nr:hypothetical protein [Clostridiales Family XIII bacterium]
MDNNYVFQNMNLNSINFVNDKNDILFEFIDSHKGEYYGELLCEDVLSMVMTTDLDFDPYFPQFICDVSIEEYTDKSSVQLPVMFPGGSVKESPEKSAPRLVMFQGGGYEIFLTCRKAHVKKIE